MPCAFYLLDINAISMKRRRFIKNTLAGTAFTASGAMFSFKKAYSAGDKTLKHRALAAFRRFEAVWEFNDFWKRGNTMDACLTFAAAAIKKWPEDHDVRGMQVAVRDMLEKDLAYFNGFDIGGMWADDFGWWGLMGINARKHLLDMGEHEMAGEYLELSEKCWEHMVRTAYDHSPGARPVPHGCRNGDAKGMHKGVKNTVTNVLLFLLSSRLYRMNKAENRDDNAKYLDMARRQWEWFDAWFELDEYEYLKKIPPSAALVQERPMAFFEGSGYTDKDHPPWAEGWVWTGDQGMMLAALTDMLLLKNDLKSWYEAQSSGSSFDEQAFTRKVKNYINLISNGVKQALVARVDGIIREAPCLSSFGPRHGGDYLAGRGILMRYMGAGEVKRQIPVEMHENVMKTVDAIWQHRDKATNQFTPEYTEKANDALYIQQFRKLWGLADDVYTWDIKNMKEQQKFGVCQAVGLDVLGAAIKLL